MNRPAAAALVLLLIAACRIHVTIWFFGHPVAHPPVAGLILVVLAAAAGGILFLIWRALTDTMPAARPATWST
jgi:hypothetical protein